MGAIDAAALGPFKESAHGHGREEEKNLFYFGCGTISGKSLQLLPPDQWSHFSQTLGRLTFHTQLLLRVRYCNA